MKCCALHRVTTIRVFASVFSLDQYETELPGQDPKSSGLHPVCVCVNILCFGDEEAAGGDRNAATSVVDGLDCVLPKETVRVCG